MARKALTLSFLLLLLVLLGLSIYVDLKGSWGSGKSPDEAGSLSFPGVEIPAFFPEPQALEKKPFNILILGIEQGRQVSHSRSQMGMTIIVVHVDESRGKAVLLSLPGDSYVQLVGYEKRRISDAYAVGGAKLVVRAVEEITGMTMRNYLTLNYDQFARLVDLFGGVEMTLEREVRDPQLGFLPAGTRRLSGAEALLVVASCNYPEGELGRIGMQQAFLLALANQGYRLAGTPAAAWFLNLALREVETDLTTDEVIRLAREFSRFPIVNIEVGVAPGKVGMIGNLHVYLLDTEELYRVVRSIEEHCTIP